MYERVESSHKHPLTMKKEIQSLVFTLIRPLKTFVTQSAFGNHGNDPKQSS
jgi:hypothetical protein